MIRLFLSYASEDRDSARRLFRDLDSAPAVDIWFDQNSLLPGQQWETEIRRAIRQSDFFLLLLSKKSTAKKGFYQNEIRNALRVFDDHPEGEIYLIPIRLEECAVHFERLHSVQYVDLFPDWDAGVDKIFRAIRAHSRTPQESLTSGQTVRFTSHQAQFDPYPGCFYYFLTVSNLNSVPIEITHLWYEDIGHHIALERDSRPLPKRLEPSESWATWIAVSELPQRTQDDAYRNFGLRLSDGNIFQSNKDDTVPPHGTVPGGEILQSDLDIMAENSAREAGSRRTSLQRLGMSPDKADKDNKIR